MLGKEGNCRVDETWLGRMQLTIIDAEKNSFSASKTINFEMKATDSTCYSAGLFEYESFICGQDDILAVTAIMTTLVMRRIQGLED